jgi:hypothetical protein
MSSGVKLNFINRSNSGNSAVEVILYQKNQVRYHNAAIVAWKVISQSKAGETFAFSYTHDLKVACSDSYGNYTQQLQASPGKKFGMVRTDTGEILQPAGTAFSPEEVDVQNNLNTGTISAWIYNGDATLAGVTDIVPGQKASFKFKDALWIGVSSEVIEVGEILDALTLSETHFEIPLQGILRADIVMTGGGKGPSAEPYTFTLENIVAS